MAAPAVHEPVDYLPQDDPVEGFYCKSTAPLLAAKYQLICTNWTYSKL